MHLRGRETVLAKELNPSTHISISNCIHLFLELVLW